MLVYAGTSHAAVVHSLQLVEYFGAGPFGYAVSFVAKLARIGTLDRRNTKLRRFEVIDFLVRHKSANV